MGWQKIKSVNNQDFSNISTSLFFTFSKELDSDFGSFITFIAFTVPAWATS